MARDVAADVDGDGQTRDVRRRGDNVQPQARRASAQPLHADAGLVDGFKQLFFQLCVERVGVGRAQRQHQRALGVLRHLLEVADADAQHHRRAGVRARRTHGVQHEALHAVNPAGGREHPQLAHILAPKALGRNGQRQRIAIARGLMLDPDVVIADEPVSALDVSVRAQVLNLMMDLQQELGLSYVFISHDLSVVEHIADEVMVMYLGRCVEKGTKDQIFNNPRHPYTQALLSATPRLNPDDRRERIKLTGELPSPLNPPPGCAFNARCRRRFGPCTQLQPQLKDYGGQLVACFAVDQDENPQR